MAINDMVFYALVAVSVLLPIIFFGLHKAYPKKEYQLPAGNLEWVGYYNFFAEDDNRQRNLILYGITGLLSFLLIIAWAVWLLKRFVV